MNQHDYSIRIKKYGKDILDSQEFIKATHQVHHLRTSVANHSLLTAKIGLKVCDRLKKRGITVIIPFFGPFIGAIPSALIILMDSPLCCLLFVIFVVILQTVDGNVIGPMLLSGSVGLSGFWVLFAITLFGGLFGIVGILVGVPVFAVIYDFIKRQVYKLLERHGITEFLPKKTEDTQEQPQKT